jgi:hypothetical protein
MAEIEASIVRELPPRELVVVARPEAALRAAGDTVASAEGLDVGPLARLLRGHNAELRLLFGTSEESLQAEAVAAPPAAPGQAPPDLSVFYRVEAPEHRLEELAAELLGHEGLVAAAFVKPPAEPARLNDMAPSAPAAPLATPDFTPLQGYLNAAPAGIDARFAWGVAGGTGAGVRIIDVEGAWRLTHEDLGANQGGVIGGTPTTDLGWRNHGTAVLGVFSGDSNGFGVTGICPDAFVRTHSVFGSSSSQAIVAAANLLNPGDILLIELHRPGPRFNFTLRGDQRGYIAVEWWPDDLAAIQYAVSRGVVVVEAAGNGGEDLDDALYDTPDAGFPASWRNPFRRNPDDSGAVVVGAGAPPSGVFGPDRCRLDFSNFGALVDAQGWGREVVTCGYGDLQGGSEDAWYTRSFSGTSSASPVIVGAVGCMQGARLAAGAPPRTPAEVRALLRATGSPQQNGPAGPAAQRIGNRPDLQALLAVP